MQNRCSELLVKQADFFPGINLKTAEVIGFDIPDEMLQQVGRNWKLYAE